MANHRNVMNKSLILDRIKRDSNKCWNWTAYTLNSGYGQINVANRQYQAHRIAAFLWNGFDLDSNLLVCHACDNRRCVNPKHLFVGSYKDNSADMVKKGRQARGEACGSSKLRKADIFEIRRMLQAGFNYKEIASKFHVTWFNIQQIKLKHTWRHL